MLAYRLGFVKRKMRRMDRGRGLTRTLNVRNLMVRGLRLRAIWTMKLLLQGLTAM